MNFARCMSFLAALFLAQSYAFAAFDSGSTGADGAFAPTGNTTVVLPPNGVLNYTSVSIPAGVTVRFKKNTANTPVTMLVSGNVSIAGIIDISGANSSDPSTAPYILGVSNKGGVGGPGGFDGGMGGRPEQNREGGWGYGPAGGRGGTVDCNQSHGGGGFASPGGAYCGDWWSPTYGSNSMLPLIGGSGGGGRVGGPFNYSPPGWGGGGGGGALLIVTSGNVNLTGKISAVGGSGNAGGGGAGGMVRIIGTGYSGSGSIDMGGGSWGGAGRSSIEVVPNAGSFSLSFLPTLAITSIGGAAVPTNPTGVGDVSVPVANGNPLDVMVSASGIPVGTVIKLTLNNNMGAVTTVNTSPLAGTLPASAATGSINIPSGATVLTASASYTLTLAQGEALKVYAEGERVEKVSLASVMGGDMQVTLITATGKEFVVPVAVLATLQAELG